MTRTGSVRFGDAFDDEERQRIEDINNLLAFGVGVLVGVGIVSIGLIPFISKIEGQWILFARAPL